MNFGTGQCLDNDINKEFIVTNHCNGGQYQNWSINGKSGNKSNVQNHYGAQQCLDSNGNGDVYRNNCDDGNPYRNWYIGS